MQEAPQLPASLAASSLSPAIAAAGEEQARSQPRWEDGPEAMQLEQLLKKTPLLPPKVKEVSHYSPTLGHSAQCPAPGHNPC